MPLRNVLLEKWEFEITSMMKLKLQYIFAERLSLARARMNLNTAGTFYNLLDKVATENNLSDTPGNVSNIDQSGR